MRRVLVCWLLGLCLPHGALAARPVLLSDEPMAVRLRQGQPTAITFPEPIASVPTGADPAQLSVELEGTRLFLQPLDPRVQGLLFVVGASGRSYPVRFAVGTPPDTEVLVTLPPAPPRGGPADTSPPPGLTVRMLLVALLQGNTVPGVTEAADRQVLLETARLRITTTRVYIAGFLLGYQAEAVNKTDAALPLLLPEYYAPGLKAITAEAEVLPPQGQTRVYLVFQPGVPH
jgi:hypothetical protein